MTGDFMKRPQRIALIVLGVIFLLLMVPAVRWVAANVRFSFTTGKDHTSSQEEERSRKARGLPQETWRLPFSLPPRLTAEQTALLQKDPRGAVEAHSSDEAWKTQLSLISAWAQLDPATATAWVEAQPDDGYSTRLAALVAGLMTRPNGLEVAERFMALHEEDERLLPKFRGEGLRWLVFQQVANEESIAPALECIRLHPDQGWAERLVASLPATDQQIAALHYFSAKGVKFEFHYADLAEMMEKEAKSVADWADTKQPELLGDVLAAWSLIDKSETPERWLDGSISEPTKKEELRKILRARHLEHEEE